MVDIALFREGMRHLTASVNVITTEANNERTGCTASAVCSLSDNPPSLVVCLNQSTNTSTVVKESGKLCVNLCSSSDAAVSNAFAKSSSDNKFDTGEWKTTPLGSPQLASAVVAFDCEVGDIIESGTHYVIVGHIKNIILSEDAESQALLYGNGKYGSFVAS